MASSSTRSSTQPLRDVAAKDARCCCCSAHRTVAFCSAITFLLGIGLLVTGAIVNERAGRWGLQSFSLLGDICVALGVVLSLTSLLGLCASGGSLNTRNVWLGDSGPTLPLLANFMLNLMLASFMALAGVYAAVENSKLKEYVRTHWDEVSARVGANDCYRNCEGKEVLTYEEAVHTLHTYLGVLLSFSFFAMSVLGIALIAAARILGVRSIAYGFLTALGLLGLFELAVALLTRGQIAPATTWMLMGCSGVQIITSITGICGFRRHHRECLFWSSTILALAAVGIGIICVSTYMWLRNTRLKNPQHLLLVFAISLVALFFMLNTLCCVGCLYCKRRRAFEEADQAVQIKAEWSDYGGRERSYGAEGKRKKKKRRQMPNEYTPAGAELGSVDAV